MSVTEREKLDHCPDCSLPFEIAAVSLRFFRKSAMLSVCPNCGQTAAKLASQYAIDSTPLVRSLRSEQAASCRLVTDGSGTVHLAPAVSALKSECENGRGHAIVGQRRRAAPT
jgi:hypothetical protein